MPTIIEESEDIPEGDETEDADSNEDESSDDEVTLVKAPEAGKIILPDPVLGTTEIGALTFFRNFVSSSTTALEETTDTDQALGATIQELTEKIDRMRKSIDAVKEQPISIPIPSRDTLGSIKVGTALKPIYDELDSIKNDVLPRLTATQASLKKIESFIERNAEFLAASLEYQEKLSLVQSEYVSLEKRVARIEASLEKTWNRNFGYLTLAVAVIGTLVATYAAFFRP